MDTLNSYLRQQGRDNYTRPLSDSDLDLFLHCWVLPHCPACVSSPRHKPCAWCPTSQTCVPNYHALHDFPYPFEIFAPIKYDDICPLGWRERWEIRTPWPLGGREGCCWASSATITAASASILGTLLFLVYVWMLIIFGKLFVRGIRRFSNYWRRRNLEAPKSSSDGRHIEPTSVEDGERDPLLSPTRT
jgi:hypothetical protein